MDDFSLVEVPDRLADLPEDAASFGPVEGLLLDPLLEAAALDVLQHQRCPAAGGLGLEVHQFDDIWVPELAVDRRLVLGRPVVDLSKNGGVRF